MCKARGIDATLLQEPLVVGVSGGADSLALLRILLALRSDEARTTIHVGHLDHRFRGSESAADMEFVAQICREWRVSFTTESFDVPAYARSYKLSAEDAARRTRYAFLGALAQERSATVVVAHTADDQAETVLMNIIRGTGISGLGGMRWLSALPPSQSDEDLDALGSRDPANHIPLFRPLLGTWRKEIEAYCHTHSLQPRLDTSNLDMAYRRNKVRHELIPLLSAEYNGSVKRHLWELADIASQEDDAIEAVVARLWPTLIAGDSPPGTVRIQTAKLAAEPDAIKRRVARLALSKVAGTLDGFEHEHIAAVADMFSTGKPARSSADLPHGILVERRGEEVYISPKGILTQSDCTASSSDWPTMETEANYDIKPGEVINLDGGWTLSVVSGPPLPVAVDAANLTAQVDADTLGAASNIVVRTREPGDRIAPFGLGGTRSLQDLFVDAKIPVGYRSRIPLLAFRDTSEILWVPGVGGRRSSHAPVNDTTKSVLRFRFERSMQGEN